MKTPIEQLLSLAKNPQQEVDLRTIPSFISLKRRFLNFIASEYFQKENADKCWEWQGCKNHQGYGTITWNNKKYRANRIAYIIFNGIIPPEELIRHTCDNKSCVNPKHLITGTYQDNFIDSVKRNNHGKQILNEEAVKVIKWMLKYRPKHGLVTKLAKLHNVSRQTIGSIKEGKSWRWVTI